MSVITIGDDGRRALAVPRMGTVRIPGTLATWLEATAFAGVLSVALVVRLVHLDTVPSVVTADETGNLNDAYRIIEGTGAGFFGFDWKPAPALSMYQLAWTIRVFGDGVGDFRMYPVILSMLTLAMFYLLVRRAVGAPAALLALALLATNLWVLHFSRTAWENIHTSLFALGACWATLRALESGRAWWWMLAGVFIAFGLYGYFSGRFIFIAVVLMAVLAIVLRQAPWRRTVAGLGVAGVVSAALFAPMAVNIARNWDDFTRRSTSVSIFTPREEANVRREAPEPDYGWPLAWAQLKRNVGGFILQDGDQMNYGLAVRYTPENRPPLDFAVAVLFWAGLAVALYRWRQTYAWFTFFVPFFMVQVFSRGTPDLARGVLIAPFLFLFVAIALDELFRRLRGARFRAVALAGAVLVASWVSFNNVSDYFEWQRQPDVLRARFPGVDVCEFEAWRDLAYVHAADGSNVRYPEWEAMRDEIACSPLRERAVNRP